jgi:hypothetical protein
LDRAHADGKILAAIGESADLAGGAGVHMHGFQ